MLGWATGTCVSSSALERYFAAVHSILVGREIMGPAKMEAMAVVTATRRLRGVVQHPWVTAMEGDVVPKEEGVGLEAHVALPLYLSIDYHLFHSRKPSEGILTLVSACQCCVARSSPRKRPWRIT